MKPNPTRIPKDKYIQTPVGPRVTRELVVEYHGEAQANRFFRWMYGQTQDSYGMYPWDYERWIAGLPVID